MVKFRKGISEESIKAIQDKLGIETISVSPKSNIYRMKIKNRASVEEIVNSLQSLREVEYSEPNYVFDFQ